MAKNNKKPKQKYFPTRNDTGDISKEEWEKWNIDYFGESNFYDGEYPEDEGDEPKELDFDRD